MKFKEKQIHETTDEQSTYFLLEEVCTYSTGADISHQRCTTTVNFLNQSNESEARNSFNKNNVVSETVIEAKTYYRMYYYEQLYYSRINNQHHFKRLIQSSRS